MIKFARMYTTSQYCAASSATRAMWASIASIELNGAEMGELFGDRNVEAFRPGALAAVGIECGIRVDGRSRHQLRGITAAQVATTHRNRREETRESEHCDQVLHVTGYNTSEVRGRASVSNDARMSSAPKVQTIAAPDGKSPQ